jgi:hypothetical protein
MFASLKFNSMRDGKTSLALKRLNLAKRKAGVDRRRETVYLSALEAIKALFIWDYVHGLLKDAKAVEKESYLYA